MQALSPRARELLRAAREEGPPPGSKPAVRRAVAASIATGAVISVAGTAAAGAGASAAAGGAGGALLASKGALMSLIWWGGGGMAMGAMLVGVAGALGPSEHAAREPARAPALLSAVVTSAPAVASVRSLPAPSPSPSAAPPPPPTVGAPVSAPAPSRANVKVRPDVAEELRMLDAARAALRDDDPARALALADAHQKRFGEGALSEEAAAARVLALCALGRTAEGGAAAAEFTRSYPHSPQVARVRAACTKNP